MGDIDWKTVWINAGFGLLAVGAVLAGLAVLAVLIALPFVAVGAGLGAGAWAFCLLVTFC